VFERRFGVLAALAAVWTFAVWGGRIGMLEANPETNDLFRIGLSLVFGLALAIVAVRALRHPPPGQAEAWLGVAFAAWMVIVWVPDAVRLIGSERSAGFVAVHLGLAAVSVALGLALAASAQEALRRPGELAHHHVEPDRSKERSQIDGRDAE
jgi:hypothetical protein